jgi:cytochrome d ubiquinol oxidase subunit II
VIVSFLAGLATLALVYRRRFEPARYGAALAVASIIAGWALAKWPKILPGLTVQQAAAGHDTLVWVIACVLAGAAILFPSLVLLFRLSVSGRLRAVESTPPERTADRLGSVKSGRLARVAIACLIAGFGLLNLADAGWAHAIGVACLFGFIVTAFRVIVSAALDEQPAARAVEPD